MSSPAVITFFVLSGYLIAFSLNENYKRNCYISASQYLRSRFKRIFPPLLISVILTGLIFVIIQSLNLHGSETYLHPLDKIQPSRLSYDFDFQSAIGTLLQTYAFGPGTYLTANGPLWSLSYEVGFYILILCIALLVTTPFLKPTFFISSLVFLGVIFSIVLYKKWLFIFYAALCLMGLGTFLIESKYRKQTWTIFSFFLVALIISIRTNTFNNLEFLCAVIVIVIIRQKDKIGEMVLMRGRLSTFLTSFAKSTYSLYILHFPVFLFGFSLFHKSFYDTSEAIYFICTSGYTILSLILIHRVGLIIENNFIQKFI